MIAAAGLGAHQLTGSPVPDAAGSILVGVLLGVVAILLINRNLRSWSAEESTPGYGRPPSRPCWPRRKSPASPT